MNALEFFVSMDPLWAFLPEVIGSDYVLFAKFTLWFHSFFICSLNFLHFKTFLANFIFLLIRNYFWKYCSNSKFDANFCCWPQVTIFYSKNLNSDLTVEPMGKSISNFPLTNLWLSLSILIFSSNIPGQNLSWWQVLFEKFGFGKPIWEI